MCVVQLIVKKIMLYSIKNGQKNLERNRKMH